MQLVIPMIAYEDGVTAIEWLCRVFGFTEKLRWLDDSGRLSHGEIAIGDQVIMLASPTPGYQSPKRLRQEYAPAALWYQTPYIINGVLVYVEDVETHFKQSSELGALILTGLEYGGPGTRYRVEDLEGQRWMFMQKP
ncbi:MAG TPA: VOC family protein [Puia sp.]